jgi:hypothetical protein
MSCTQGLTPTHPVSSQGPFEVIRVLWVELGVDVGYTGEDGSPQSVLSCLECHDDTSWVLVAECGCDSTFHTTSQGPWYEVSDHGRCINCLGALGYLNGAQGAPCVVENLVSLRG